jgi:Ca-activated chloride channel family protein
MVSLIAALAVFAVAALAEWLHARRLRRVAYLAFGPDERPRSWTTAVGPLRVIAAAATAWGLMTLYLADPSGPLAVDLSTDPRSIHHLVIALDVSPSMHLIDAGQRGEQTRGDRARDAVRSVLERLDPRRTRVSIVAFYTTARPVVIDTFDPEVTANVLADLPLEHAFSSGKTDLYSSVKAAAELGAAWRDGSATLLLLSDGDTLPTHSMPALPRSFANAVVAGVGNSQRGTYIDGHSSKQDKAALEKLAAQLSGRYFDANVRQLPAEHIAQLVPPLPEFGDDGRNVRMFALVAIGCGSATLALLPLALALAGTGHRPWRLARRTLARPLARETTAVGPGS